jgi:ADP-ribose pyrophosphatase YjhB (NUDIX family)
MKHYIIKLKKRGYEIRLPGGKSRDGSLAAFGAIVRGRIENGRLIHEVLVIPYRLLQKGEKDAFPDEKEFFEEPEQTLEREIPEETGILIHKGQYYLLGSMDVDDYRTTVIGVKHWKHAYVIYKYDASNIRRKPSPYQKTILPPFWLPIDSYLEQQISVHHYWIIALLKKDLPHLPVQKFEVSKFKKKEHFEPALV